MKNKRTARLIFALGASLALFSAHAQTKIIKDTTITNGNFGYPAISVQPVTSIIPGQGQQVDLFYGISPVPLNCQALAAALSASQNYVSTIIPRKPGYDPAQQSSALACEAMQTVQYLDGLGRPLQTVMVKGNPNGTKDVVQPFGYDQFGREDKKYLPYASSSADGSYKPDALTPGNGLFSFYNPTGSGTSGDQQSNSIVVNPYPFSPTGFEASPLDRPLQQGAPGLPWQLIGSGINGAGHVMQMAYGTNADSEVPLWQVNTSGASYTNYYPAGQLYKNVTTDENGDQTIEFKDKQGRIVCKKAQSGASSFITTSYVYNDLDQLAYVVPPGVSASSFTEANTDASFTGFVYAYHYDERGRLVTKKIPGKGREFIVYNTLDQVVATQDSVQRPLNHWTFTKYDALGRVVMTGEITDNRDRVSLAAYLAAQTQNWETPTTNGDGYSTVSYPGNWNQLYTVNYYDDYTFPNAGSYQSSPATNASSATKGLLTGSKVNILGSTTMLLKELYYDDKGRLAETVEQNHIGGNDRTVNTYNFNDQVTQTTRMHNSSTVNNLNIVNSYAYDHMGRKVSTTEQIGNGFPVTLSQTTYNEIGQLKTKDLGNNIQAVNYTYNERGWMVKESAQRFAMQLKYNTGNVPQYNGNISQMNYTGTNSGAKTFNYTYDNLNRLTNARSTNGTLDEQLTYDPMGNIATLTRAGQNYGMLNYAYENNNQSNRLSSVTGTNFNRSYAYDANGNATSDGGSKSITYNYLNLPASVGNVATYTYDATGKKLTNTGTDGRWDYLDGIVYKNNNIAFIQTEEGRAKPSSGSYAYQYDLKDHLGNTRVSIDQSANVLQEDEFYAFGLCKNVVDNNNSNRYLYNGKEIQTDLTGQYDYGARFYDPVIGRWTTVDPSAEEGDQESLTPYQYGLNNPIKNTDPDGRCPSCIIGGIVGGLVDYGEQVATNYVQGNKNPWTSNINLVSIGTAALAGAATSGASVVENLTAKTVLKVGAKVLPTVINNIVEVNTTDGVKVHNATDVVKNSVIDFAADGVAGKIGGKVEGALSKVGVTNAGRLSSNARAVVRATGNNVTRATTATVKAGLKVATKVVAQTTESTVKAVTNQKRDELKKNTNTGN